MRVAAGTVVRVCSDGVKNNSRSTLSFFEDAQCQMVININASAV
jgi:hypothetical protein